MNRFWNWLFGPVTDPYVTVVDFRNEIEALRASINALESKAAMTEPKKAFKTRQSPPVEHTADFETAQAQNLKALEELDGIRKTR